ncbi:hypothetical protein A2276_01075 [candidate division WOR-1 bacterium RIFOXYA12_FULL_43_27]|uniref:BFN domain-containing protein n=1 Tax=candidate division WOR-1 bacterium RIFOXYC2_FULL_46_14 TaxID=1802587 RepID=A0A1F4U4Q0_UNCSA|nr:MAG: hypothetical protein A2276_01075 [candidate division WOR-1 bacterium RIFOXYA12_FULL_43_27]OGC20722.1 MAG: hypothetical protein A2292_06800 [candidate division WOR-1 bacterium RIFOXYB2_FULL_46_45]OGC31541.1 MAG: hypothetical protein A2232_04650 [candidate division WOR-1 bacterium RIFOXYA2_FULL_46_56]OGC39948.1 MAG: hypothetical protein A2438_05490 [candidate division WOR-1 bacterium RIFOXYC2_FULL_46_14]
MIQMSVGGLGFDPRNLSPMILLRDPEEMNFLPIWIGIFEAASIALVLQGIKPPRPMTHDLLKDVIEKSGCTINRVVISEIQNGTFFSVIELMRGEKKISIDARPSDAIALAMRGETPIFVSENVMLQAKLVNADRDAEEARKFKEFVSNLKPEDFTKYYNKD